jgi:GNAT superfamily N-acetyltransferase
VRIRPATEDDLVTINDVWLDADGIDERSPAVLPLHDHELRTGTLLVAERDGGIAGFGAVLERDGVTYLADLFVRRHHQSSGVGRALLDALFAVDASPVRATLASTDPRAQWLYRAFGMHERFTVRHLSTTRRWPAPSPLIVAPIAIGDELADLDKRFYGRARRVDLDYWARLGAVAATFADAAGVTVGYAFVCPHTPWRVDGDCTRVGPIVARDQGRAVAVVHAALAFAAGLEDRARAMTLSIAVPHPAFPTLTAAGFTGDVVDVFMSSRVDVVDPERTTLTADLL